MGLTLILLFVLVAAAAPWLAPPLPDHNPYEIPKDFAIGTPFPQPPNWTAWQAFPPDWRLHPLGTTGSDQYDLYYGVIWGTRTAFAVAGVIVGFSMLIGIVLGCLSEYFGGFLDNIIMRVVDILLALPFLVLIVVLSVLLGAFPSIDLFGFHWNIQRLWIAVVAITLGNWITYARLVRGDLLSDKEKDYVLAVRSIGAGDAHIMIRHLLPNIIPSVLIYASLDFGSQALTVSALSFVGLGAPIGYADWGQLVNNAQNWIIHGKEYWYVLVVPVVFIALFVLGFNLLGDAARDILDPRAQRH
jgi:peptide/nickel transport system permease protein